MQLHHFETMRRAAREHLEQARGKLMAEIRVYPTPITACDVQFNTLLELRQRVAAELAALDALAPADAAGKSAASAGAAHGDDHGGGRGGGQGGAPAVGALEALLRASPFFDEAQVGALLSHPVGITESGPNAAAHAAPATG